MFVLTILVLNLTVSLFGYTDLVYMNNFDIKSTEQLNTDTGEMTENNQSLAYKVDKWSNDDDKIRTYLNPGVQGSTQTYLQAGGDFIRGLYIFYEVFVKGTVLLSPTLINFGMNKQLTFIFDIILMFAYALATIQFISGRQLEPTTY